MTTANNLPPIQTPTTATLDPGPSAMPISQTPFSKPTSNPPINHHHPPPTSTKYSPSSPLPPAPYHASYAWSRLGPPTPAGPAPLCFAIYSSSYSQAPLFLLIVSLIFESIHS
ncbi:hypothetical protein CIPAW_09G059600 [Carya illinoinensis]|uniref:Uncharacterized protein n=1 Tax=Carya illinoinensis TaxID=32201 RepID=A0A8T1PEE8_CARIL|nr:hypothetical protein CIPAW_09G059600 [Carya illinoinensis]